MAELKIPNESDLVHAMTKDEDPKLMEAFRVLGQRMAEQAIPIAEVKHELRRLASKMDNASHNIREDIHSLRGEVVTNGVLLTSIHNQLEEIAKRDLWDHIKLAWDGLVRRLKA